MEGIGRAWEGFGRLYEALKSFNGTLRPSEQLLNHFKMQFNQITKKLNHSKMQFNQSFVEGQETLTIDELVVVVVAVFVKVVVKDVVVVLPEVHLLNRPSSGRLTAVTPLDPPTSGEHKIRMASY